MVGLSVLSILVSSPWAPFFSIPKGSLLHIVLEKNYRLLPSLSWPGERDNLITYSFRRRAPFGLRPMGLQSVGSYGKNIENRDFMKARHILGQGLIVSSQKNISVGLFHLHLHNVYLGVDESRLV